MNRCARHAVLATTATLLALCYGQSADGEPERHAVALRGSVQSRQSRIEGELRFEAEGLVVGHERLAWQDVLTIAIQTQPKQDAGTQWIHLTTGDRWCGHVLELRDGVARVQTLLGEMAFPRALLTAVDFQPDLPWPPQREQTLTRREGGPVPGRLLRMDPEHMVIESPIGELKISRAMAERYTFTHAIDAERGPALDELILSDGSTLRGQLDLGPEAVTITRQDAEPMRVPWTHVRALRRQHRQVIYVALLTPSQRIAKPLLAEKLDIALFHKPLRRDGVLEGWRTQPTMQVTYDLRAAALQGPARFRVTLAPTPDASGTTVCRVLADDRELWKQAIGPDESPLHVDVALGAASQLTLEVEFGNPARFPVGVDWLDPVILIEGAKP